MFGINGGELVIILVLAVLVIGPERLPGYAEQLATLVRKTKSYLAEAKVKVTEELGPEIGDVDWAQLDPRRYDPRRIVRDALLEDTVLDPRKKGSAAGTTATAVAGGVGLTKPSGTTAAVQRLAEGTQAPFDSEAT